MDACRDCPHTPGCEGSTVYSVYWKSYAVSKYSVYWYLHVTRGYGGRSAGMAFSSGWPTFGEGVDRVRVPGERTSGTRKERRC